MKAPDTTQRLHTTTSFPAQKLEQSEHAQAKTVVLTELTEPEPLKRPEGTLPQLETQGRGSSVVQTLLEQQEERAPRRRGHRTGALRLVPKETLIAQVRKPAVRQAMREVLSLRGQISQTADKNAAAQALSTVLLQAMQTAGIAKADKSIGVLRRSGLDRLLAEALGNGTLRYGTVRGELERFNYALQDRSLTANDIKLGILAFDETAQRLALAAGKSGSFAYPAAGNRARDSLITFARSLHR